MLLGIDTSAFRQDAKRVKINILMKLFELFDTKYNWHWRKKDYDMLMAEFTTDSGDKVLTTIENIEGFWEVVFNRGGSTRTTGEGDAYKVFATVGDILSEFLEEYKPTSFSFRGDKEKVINPKAKEMTHDEMIQHLIDTGETIPYHIDNTSRVKLYGVLAKKIAKKYGYEVKEHRFDDAHIYEFTKK